MIVVMMFLLASTAAATLAIRTTSTELRSSGNERRAMQTKYIAEGGMNAAFVGFGLKGSTGREQKGKENCNPGNFFHVGHL